MTKTSLSSTQEIMPLSTLEGGYLKSSGSQKYRVFKCNALSLAELEVSLDGPKTQSFMDRLSEALARLPSNFEAQFVVSRERLDTNSGELFDASQYFESSLFLIEKETGKVFDPTLVQTLTEMGLAPVPASQTQIEELLSKFLGKHISHSDSKDFLTLPDVLWESSFVKAGASYIKAASLTELPSHSWAGFLQPLFSFNDEMLISLKIRIPPKAESKRNFERKRRVSHALSMKRADQLSDINSGSNASATEETLTRIMQGKETLFEISLSVFQSGRNLEAVESRMNKLVSEVSNSSGAGFFSECVGTLPVLRSHMPLSKTLSVREHPILSRNLSHLLPLFFDYSREQSQTPLLLASRSGEICHLNLFSPRNLNFNSFVCGASGSGKSFLVNSLLASSVSEVEETQITVFDVGGSYNKLITYLGGEVVTLDKSSGTKLVNAHLRSMKIEPSSYQKTILRTFCTEGPHFTHSHEVAIEDLLKSCEGASFHFTTLINEALERKETVFADIAFWLRPFKEWDDIKVSRFDLEPMTGSIRSFDFKTLEGEERLQKLVLLTLTQDIWTRLKEHKAPRSIVVFDEVWKFFKSASSYLEEMYRTFRKYRAGIVTVTQNLSDYGDDDFAKLIISISYMRILLQGAATSSVLSETLDLEASDIERLQSVSSQKGAYSEFWLGTPNFSQIMRLYPTETLYKLANSENLFLKGESHE